MYEPSLAYCKGSFTDNLLISSIGALLLIASVEIASPVSFWYSASISLNLFLYASLASASLKYAENILASFSFLIREWIWEVRLALNIIVLRNSSPADKSLNGTVVTTPTGFIRPFWTTCPAFPKGEVINSPIASIQLCNCPWRIELSYFICLLSSILLPATKLLPKALKAWYK